MSRLDDWACLHPEGKLPKLGTEGETYRQHQLTLQLPKQDLSLKHCQHVSGQRDRASYQDFVCARNDIAMDTGHVTTVTSHHCNEGTATMYLAWRFVGSYLSTAS